MHWPSSKCEDDYPAVWASSRRLSVADTMSEGDLVAVYETKTEPGTDKAGEGRIVGHSKVRARVCDVPDDNLPWVLVARLEKPLYDDGGATREEMDAILGYRIRYGLQDISEEKFDHLTRRRLRRA